ncbi:MAG: GNAT family N-acetyltransferase [Alphaproteobacteria bacterium]|nr:GNAT family N-acetyltransferase [Alphaproteobacteria bacterium]
MSAKLIPVDQPEAWTAALEGLATSFWHSRECCAALSAAGDGAVALYHDEATACVCPLLLRDSNGGHVATPYGYSGFALGRSSAAPAERWTAFARAQGWITGFIGLNPALPEPKGLDPAEMSERGECFLLDLAVGRAALEAGLTKNIQSKLQEWRRCGAQLVFDQAALIRFFVAQYEGFVSRIGASASYRFPRETLSAIAAAPSVFLVGAAQSDRLEAVSVFARLGDQADYLFNVALPEGRHHSAALLWAGIERLVEDGARTLNLGGGIEPGDGLAQFKRRFGAQRVPRKVLKQIFDADRYRELCAAAGRKPTDLNGFFPPYASR